MEIRGSFCMEDISLNCNSLKAFKILIRYTYEFCAYLYSEKDSYGTRASFTSLLDKVRGHTGSY